VARWEGSSELRLHAKEAARLWIKGDRVDQISNIWGWSKAEVAELLQTSEFLAYLRQGAPDQAKIFEETFNADVAIINAKAFVQKNLDGYLKGLDDLAQNARAENVRLSAIMSLLKAGGFMKEDVDVDNLDPSPKELEVLEKAMRAARSNRGPVGKSSGKRQSK